MHLQALPATAAALEKRLAGTVKHHERHLFLCNPAQGWDDWKSVVEFDHTHVASAYHEAYAKLKQHRLPDLMHLKVTAYHMHSKGAGPSDGSHQVANVVCNFFLKTRTSFIFTHLHLVSYHAKPRQCHITIQALVPYTVLHAFTAQQIIVYPDRVTATVRSADSSTIEQLTRLLATCDTPFNSSDSPLAAAVGQLRPLVGHDVFCCTHGSRDARCGAAGPLAVQHMQHAAQEAGFAVGNYDLQTNNSAQSDSPQPFRVWGCAHVGGHR
jgi:Sucrase/ferredoxin-like